MSDLLEFFVPSHARDLENIDKTGTNQYHVTEACEFDVPQRQQLDDLTRIFDCIHRERAPTAIFSKPELFSVLFSYIKAMEDRDTSSLVAREARHKICHDSAERLKKLLLACVSYLKKNEGTALKENVLMSSRSAIKMYVFILCNTLLSTAPSVEDDDGVPGSFNRATRKRKRTRGDQEAGIGEDSSGVDQDGREQALSALVDVCSQDISRLWPGGVLEESMLNLMFRMLLHMITQKCNIHADAQSVSGALVILLLKLSTQIMARGSVEPNDFVCPMIELALKSEATTMFFTRFISEAENENVLGVHVERVVAAFVEGVCSAALYDVVGDPVAAKSVALFLSEVARKCVSVTARMSDSLKQMINSESYEVRKSVVTCITEIIIQRYGGLNCTDEGEETRNVYLSEMLSRLVDCNPFVRNHTLHMWDKLLEGRAVPKRYRVLLTEAVVSRLEDRNYLVRDSALQVIVSILNRSWFGHLLTTSLLNDKLNEITLSGRDLFDSESKYMDCLESARKVFRNSGNNIEKSNEEIEEAPMRMEVTKEQESAIERVLSLENSLYFAKLISKSLEHATSLLDSRTERDVVEAIKLVVACNRRRVDGAGQAFLRVIVMVYEGELKIQYAVRDAFVEVVFDALAKPSIQSIAQSTESVRRLITFLIHAEEGEISAVDRIFSLMKVSASHWRLLSGSFIDALWGIASGSIDSHVSLTEKRIAMRLFSILCKHDWHVLVARKDNVVDLLLSGTLKDNVVLAYCLRSLEVQSQNPRYTPIPATNIPDGDCVLRQLIFNICRPTTALSSWMIVADAAISAVQSLCEIPIFVYVYVLDYLKQRLGSDDNTQAQLFFILGRTALKLLVAIDCLERQQLKRISADSTTKKSDADQTVSGTDDIHKELGLGSRDHLRHTIQEQYRRCREDIMSEGSLWHSLSKNVVAFCKKKTQRLTNNTLERVCAVMALSELMIVSDKFCEKQLDLLFSIVSNAQESWVVKTNAVIALGDLACVHPSIVAPYMKDETSGFFQLLNDTDVRVRAVTIQVCSHLVLGDMLRVGKYLYILVKLVADPNEAIAKNAVTFVQNLAMKEKEKTGNLIPPLVDRLTSLVPSDKFQLAMRSLLERVEGDKPTESLIERLCQRFPPYSECGAIKQKTARNLAFCLHELSYVTERSIKKITSEACYKHYKQWLREDAVLDYFKGIASKAKKVGQRVGSERRDRAAIEEWETRMQIDSCSLEPVEEIPDNTSQHSGDESS